MLDGELIKPNDRIATVEVLQACLELRLGDTLNLRMSSFIKDGSAKVDIDASQLTETQLHAKLQRGYDDYKEGRTHNAAEAFVKFRESHT